MAFGTDSGEMSSHVGLPRRTGWVFLVFLASLLTVATGISSAQQPSPQALPLTVSGLAGNGGDKATNELGQLLQRISPFSLKPTQGAPVAAGTVGEGFVDGQLSSADGRVLFQRKYQRGSLGADLRQFADDIVLTLTKRPGIATSQIAFSFSESGKPFQIYACDFDGGNLRQLTTSSGSHVAPALSPDGRLLANVVLQQGDRGVVQVVDLEKSKVSSLRMNPAARIQSAISPNGKQLALSLSEDGGPNSDLYVAKLPNGKPTRLTETPVPESSPSWSPDGKRLVFSAPPAPGRSDLFVFDVRQKKSTPLPTGKPMAIDPAWSPDGAQIAFVSVSGERRTLCVRPVQGGQARELTSGSQPVWGADSRHLLFVDAGGKLSLIRIDTGKISPVITGGGRVVDPTWTQ